MLGTALRLAVAIWISSVATVAAAAGVVRAPVGPHGASFVSQTKPLGRLPDYRGELRCGPACGTMEYSRHGLLMDKSDAQRILHIDQFDRRSGNAGMPPSRLLAALRADGLPVELDLAPTPDSLRQALAQGIHAILVGEMNALPAHPAVPNGASHWILVPAVRPDGKLLVHDPLTAGPADLEEASLRRFLGSLRRSYRLDRHHVESLDRGAALLVRAPADASR